MTALSLDHMLETEALLYRVARTGLDDFLKQDLTQVVVSSSGAEGDHERMQALLRPMAGRDEECRAAQGMLCRAIRHKATELTGESRLAFHAAATFGAHSMECAAEIARRMQLMVATVRAYLDDEPRIAWDLVEPCTTADRTIVLGFTAVILRKTITGQIVAASCAEDDEAQR